MIASGWVVLWLALCVPAREFGSTSELYAELVGSRQYTLVYVYSVGCQWCQRLDPHYERLPGLFAAEDGGLSVQFARIDGRKSQVFTRDFNVESYPQLLLFGPGGGAASPKDLLEAAYDGAKDFRAITNFLSKNTGQMPRWPRAPDNVYELADAESLLELEKQLAGDQAVIVLFFVNPYMCLRHQELLLEQLPNSVTGRLSVEWGSRIRLWRIDSSQERWAALANKFRVSSAPTVFVLSLTAGEVVGVELLEYDRQVWTQELELLSRLVKAAVEEDGDALETTSRDHHSVNFYRSLPERQLQIQERRGEPVDEDQEDASMADLIDRICFI